jgi:transcriptional regulator with XRE-family HTH domain
MPRRKTNATDMLIGTRIRDLRNARGLSQGELGTVLGITFQQIQKFERGANRVSASQLMELAIYFKVSLDHFFPGSASSEFKQMARTAADPRAVAALEFAMTKKGFSLLRSVAMLESDELRDCVIEFVEKLAKRTSTH